MKQKKIRTKGKLQLSKYFQEFEKGESVAIIAEPAVQPRFPKRLQGEVGIIEERRGKSYIVKVKKKKFLIEPIHLRKIKQIKNNDKK